MQVRITRIAASPKDGTFGVLTMDGEPVCVTLEDYDRSNATSISCIPTGSYTCERYSSAKYPDTYEITNVEGRSYILFHKGNTDDDTSGCILLGSHFGYLGDRKAVLGSTAAFKEFMKKLEGVNYFNLVIQENM